MSNNVILDGREVTHVEAVAALVSAGVSEDVAGAVLASFVRKRYPKGTPQGGQFMPSKETLFPPMPEDPVHRDLLAEVASGDVPSRLVLADYLSDKPGHEEEVAVLRHPDPVVVAGGGVFSLEPGPRSLVIQASESMQNPLAISVTSGGKTIEFRPPARTGNSYYSRAARKLAEMAYRLYSHHHNSLDRIPHASIGLTESDLASLQSHARRHGTVTNPPTVYSHKHITHALSRMGMMGGGTAKSVYELEDARRAAAGLHMRRHEERSPDDGWSPETKNMRVGDLLWTWQTATYPNARILNRYRATLPGYPHDDVDHPVVDGQPVHVVANDHVHSFSYADFPILHHHGGRVFFRVDHQGIERFQGWSFPTAEAMARAIEAMRNRNLA